MKVNNPGKKDLDQLVMLEQETFSEAEAASRESIYLFLPSHREAYEVVLHSFPSDSVQS